jgi:murein DD-endopeptidase MepM/ murein hydrolase activator NlpD
MTQRNNSAHNRSHSSSWQRSLPAQSLCWLGSFSLLSGGLVYAQSEPAAIDNIVPTVGNSGSGAAVRVQFQQNHSVSAPEVAKPELEFSQRRSRLRQRLNKGEISQSTTHSSSTAAIRKSTNQPEVSTSQAGESSLKTKSETSIIHRAKKLQEVGSAAPITENSSPVNTSQAPKVNSATAENQKDYNNTYIDPTDYSNGAVRKYEAPDSVVITERSSRCRTILAQGQNVSSSLCGKSPSQNQPLANSDTKLQGKHVPSWIGRSQTAHSAIVTSDKGVSGSEIHITRLTRLASGMTHSTGIAASGVTKSDYRSNRAIANNLIPSTTVNSGATPPEGGALPVPMNADKVAPRPSTVAYNIPLATTLPQIAYTGALASSVAGLLFPLPVPAPITSLFGWRIHPITGDRRFHSGTDLGAAMGTPVLAAYPGTVETADYVSGYGLTVILNHNNAQQTLYGHMSQLLVKPGQVVQQGTVIGLVGSTGNSTGPHLHFEVRNLTPEGWVATDPGVQLENALSQLVQTLQTAHVTQSTQSQNPPTKRVN